MTNFTPNVGGRISADLYDFYRHIKGSPLNNGDPSNHEASTILTSPGVDGATDLQTSINNINDFISIVNQRGTAFASIPDGYNSYTYPNPNFYFDNTVPPLNDFLIPLFNAILLGSSLPGGYEIYERIKYGGILYIPAGTYYIDETVSVPPGITILGERYNTKIINATSLNLATSPPSLKVSPTPAPLFLVKTNLYRNTNDYVIDTENYFMFSKSTQFIGLTIGDNFIEPTLLGDVQYYLPQNTTGDNPLIMQEQGSHLEILDVRMIGRITNTGGVVDTDGGTRFAIKLDEVVPYSSGTILKISDSFIDGFEQPISFLSTGGSNDYLEINSCKIRSHGYLDNDASSENKNCIFNINDNNTIITSNYLYGNHSGLTTIVYINNVVSTPVLQSKSKVLIDSNNIVIDKQNSGSITLNILLSAISITDNITDIIYGNTFQDTYGFDVSSSGKINLVTSNSQTLNLRAGTITVNGTSTTSINGGFTNIAADSDISIDAFNDLTLDAGANINIGTISTDNIIIKTKNDGYAALSSGNIAIDALGTISIGSSDSTTDGILLTTKSDGGNISLQGKINVRAATPLTSPYEVDSSSTNMIEFAPTPYVANNTIMSLPVPTSGRIIIIKDKAVNTSQWDLGIISNSETVADTYITANGDTDEALGVSNTIFGQSFTTTGTANQLLSSCKFYLKKQSSPTGYAYAKLYAQTGSYGTGTDLPTGAALAISEPFDVSRLTGSYVFYNFIFSGDNNYALSASTNYFITIEYSLSGTGQIDVNSDRSSPSHGGSAAYYDGSWNNLVTADLIFSVSTYTSGISIEGVSGTYIISGLESYPSKTFTSDGTDWFII